MAIYPFYLGKEIARPLIKLLLESEQPVAILPGRFQPFHRGHYEAYKYLVDKFGPDRVYIATSDKTEPGRSPFNFAEKQQIITKMFGIDPSHIVQTATPYKPTEITSQLPPGTPVILGMGEKDASRMKGFASHPGDVSQMQGFDSVIYSMTVPMVSGEEDVSGEMARQVFSSDDEAAKQTLFQKMYGHENPEIMGMITGKIIQSAQQAAAIAAEKQRKAAAPKATQFYKDRITNPDTDNPISVQSALQYGPESRAYQAARTYLKGKGVLIESVSNSRMNDIKDFVDFAAQALDLKELPRVILNASKEFPKQNLSLGSFENSSKTPTITVALHGRLMADILRTLAHELVHKRQDELGLLPKATSRENSTGAPDENQANAIAGILLRKYSEINPDILTESVLLEGGAFGHMLHPYEDMDLTFGDLKELVKRSLLTGIEGPVSEKVDGQNIMVTFVDGHIRFALKETERRNRGQTALSTDGVRAKFADRPQLARSFGEAAADLDRAISGLPVNEQEKMFGNGSKFMNIEILHPGAENIIPYGKNMLVLHQTMEFDLAGNQIGMDSEGGEHLADVLQKQNAEKQPEYTIRGRQPLTILSDGEGDRAKSKADDYIGEIDGIKTQYGLRDDQTLKDYKRRAWGELLDNSGVQLSPEERTGLIRRWADGDRSFLIRKLSKEHQEWASKVDKKEGRINGDFMSPVQMCVSRLGADTILRSNELLASQNPEAAAKITDKLNDAIRTIRESDDLDAQEKLDHLLQIVNGIGLDKLAPTEGVVFSYNGKLFKYTGLFAPVNRIVNAVRFARPDSKLGQFVAKQRQGQVPQQPAQAPQASPVAPPSAPVASPETGDDAAFAGIDPALLDKTIVNSETGNEILVRSALKYPPNAPVYIAAKKLIGAS